MGRYGRAHLVSWHHRLPERRLDTITAVVLHATELPDFDEALLEADKTARESESGRGMCGHLYIDRDGTVHQLVPLERVAQHVRGHNTSSIGIELINRGRYPRWFDADHQTPTEPFPAAQVQSLLEVLRTLHSECPRLTELYRHSDLDTALVPAADRSEVKVHRRIDPGPLFPWTDVSAFWAGLGRKP
ncbi:N-acetylmuramoyl-L-alanine amidase [Streptomyces hiroshimensis]|uniref:N-acetylmuramoyl-L-alanine amidase n=1 Tax=Streptomyces hiroshimensis TaxID=66424 RepID=A0ABQ2Y9Q3_9ACTN|nr:N-acetylmuramoyl-L-alanine amidase [Streptomyces hiroshimensis]GGX76128.1 N-acetylmuramoyl-L-alanine amidase [Streptomyces hiroshimensis]